MNSGRLCGRFVLLHECHQNIGLHVRNERRDRFMEDCNCAKCDNNDDFFHDFFVPAQVKVDF